MKLVDRSKMKEEGISSVKIKMHDNRVKVFDQVKYVFKFKRNLISMNNLDSLGYRFSI